MALNGGGVDIAIRLIVRVAPIVARFLVRRVHCRESRHQTASGPTWRVSVWSNTTWEPAAKQKPFASTYMPGKQTRCRFLQQVAARHQKGYIYGDWLKGVSPLEDEECRNSTQLSLSLLKYSPCTGIPFNSHGKRRGARDADSVLLEKRVFTTF
eukprot:3831963-Rhodomonas_salina.2